MGLAKIGLEAVMDMAGFNRGMKEYESGIDEMTGKTSKFSGLLSGAGRVIGVAGKVIAGAAVTGIGALATGIGLSVKEAMSAKTAMVGLQQVIKSTGGKAGVTAEQAEALAGSLQSVTTFSDEQIMSAETMLLQFETMNAETFPEATALALDLATRLGTDAAGAAQMLGKALAEPGEGLLRLKQAGVTFTDAEEDAITAMYEAGDVAGAQKAIMDKLQSSVGGTAVAMGETLPGKIEILKNKFSDILEQIGTPFMNALDGLASKLLSALDQPEVQAAIDSLTAWLETNLPLAIQTASGWITGTLLPAFTDIATYVTTDLVPDLQGVISTVGEIIDKLKEWDRIWRDFQERIMGKPATAEETKKFWDDFGRTFQKIADWANGIVGAIEKLPDKLPDWLQGHSPPPLADWLNQIAGASVNVRANLSGVGGAVRSMPAMTQARTGGGGTFSSTSVVGDTIIQNISDPVSFILAQAMVQDRKRDRWNAVMGVA